MLSLPDVKPGERLIDLGAGDGRIVIAERRSLEPMLSEWSFTRNDSQSFETARPQ
jgi:hypothetical protein